MFIFHGQDSVICYLVRYDVYLPGAWILTIVFDDYGFKQNDMKSNNRGEMNTHFIHLATEVGMDKLGCARIKVNSSFADQ